MRQWQLAAAALAALIGVASMVLSASLVLGQTASAPCGGAPASGKAELDERISALEANLETKRKQLGAFAKGPPKSATHAALTKEVNDLEGRLLDAIYEFECLRTDWEHQRGTGEIVEITNYYVTNRRPTGRIDPDAFFSSEHQDRLHYGRITISIPASHTLGNIELPTFWKLELSSDPSRHFVIKSMTPLQAEQARDQIRHATLKLKSKALLLFVHGYNMTFTDAALRTAQLANDLAFPGAVMFFSWPSRGQARAYAQDQETVELATAPFDLLLEDIAAMPFENVYILAHSMGNRLVTKVLASRRQKGKDLSKITEVLLAAPDINAQIFKRDIAPVLSTLPGMRRTIYASSKDVALKASRVVHGYMRVGETTDGVFTFPGFETIDASKATPLMRAYGHSYIFDSSIVLADLEDAILHGKTIAQRRMKRAGTPPSSYWILE